MEAPPRIVVIGGSAGALTALQRLVERLPDDLAAAVLVVLHFPPTGVSRLAPILGRRTRLPVTTAHDGDRIQGGRIYVPYPDRHLLVGRYDVRLSRAPRENGHRPAIDPLFRSAAQHHGPDVVGVVLCGNLDDGSSGLLAIRRAGGVGVVVDPEDCGFADMPRNAVAVAEPEHVVHLDAMASLITELVA